MCICLVSFWTILYYYRLLYIFTPLKWKWISGLVPDNWHSIIFSEIFFHQLASESYTEIVRLKSKIILSSKTSALPIKMSENLVVELRQNKQIADCFYGRNLKKKQKLPRLRESVKVFYWPFKSGFWTWKRLGLFFGKVWQIIYFHSRKRRPL